MIYSFADSNNESIYHSRVLIVCGGHAIFNNMIIDRVRDNIREDCMKRLNTDNKEYLTLRDLDLDVDIGKFLEVCKVPPFVGKWYCRVTLKELSKGQKDKVDKYIKSPSKYGVLIIEITEYREFKSYLNNKELKKSKESNVIKLSYPSKRDLRQLVESKTQGIKIADKAMDLFIMRMSDNYDEYENMINMLVDCEENTIDYDRMKDILKGVENYAVDDLLKTFIVPPRGDKGKKRAYSIMHVMIDDMGAYKLVNLLKSNVDKLVLIRAYINKGYIPGRMKYSLEEFKGKLEEESPLKKLSDFALRKNISMALDTSLKDLTYMKLILSTSKSFDDESCEIVLMKLMNRALLTEERLLCNIGVQNDIDMELYNINRL